MSDWRYTTSRKHVRAVDKEDNARRRDAKRAWEREFDFAICACGNKTGCKRQPRCRACAIAEQKRERERADATVEALWAAGFLIREIALALGTTKGAVSTRINRLRRDGRIPYRHVYPKKVA